MGTVPAVAQPFGLGVPPREILRFPVFSGTPEYGAPPPSGKAFSRPEPRGRRAETVVPLGSDQPMTGMPRKIPLWTLLVAIVVAAIAYGIHHDYSKGGRQPAGTGIGGPFTLVDQDGRTVTDRAFRGRLLLVHFGYTYSPEVCPTSLSAMAEAIDRLGADGEKVVPLFISVDSRRDTPEQLKMYVAHFHPRLVGLTGTPAQVAAAAEAYRVYYAALPAGKSDPEDYPMDHTAIIYLMGRKGEFRAHFPYDTPAADIAARIREYL